MTYYGGKELAASFRTVRKNTIQVATDIPEDQYGFAAAAGVRTVAQMLVHMALSPRLFWTSMHQERLTDVTGFDFFGAIGRIQAAEAETRTKAEILGLLTREGDAFAAFLESMSEDDLAAAVTMPTGGTPVVKRRLEVLLGAKEHEMHHRAQLMLVERLLGIVPHGTRQMMAMMEAAKR